MEGLRRVAAGGEEARDHRRSLTHRSELVESGRIDGAAMAVDGRTLAEVTQDAPPPDGEVTFPIEQPFKATGALYVLRGNLAPAGALVKAAGTDRRRHSGPARVFESEEAATAAVRDGRVQAGDVLVVRYEGTAGGPGVGAKLRITPAGGGGGDRGA